MNPLASRFLGCALVVALCVSVSGCYSKATGYGGKFTFAYSSGVEIENFVKPIAPGAKLDVVAFANGTENELTITKATSSQPGVLKVSSVNERKLVLEGVSPGVADVEITTRDAAGNVLVDKMFLHVGKPAVHPLEHSCTEEREAAYVVGDRIAIYHGLATSDRRPVIGYGYAPIKIEPAPALELVAQPQGASMYMFTAKKASARVSIKSTIDGSALSARIVDRKELTQATVDCVATDDCKTLEGRARYVRARVQLGETPLCSQNALTKARSLTPEICTVSAKLEDDDGSESNREQLASITGVKFGVCKFEVTLPELDGGKGIRLTGEMKVGRMQFPGDGKRQDKEMLRRRIMKWNLVSAAWLTPKLIVIAWVMVAARRKRRAAEATAKAAE